MANYKDHQPQGSGQGEETQIQGDRRLEEPYRRHPQQKDADQRGGHGEGEGQKLEVHQDEYGVIGIDVGDQKARQSQFRSRRPRPEGIRAGNARPRIGRQGDGRREVRRDAEVEHLAGSVGFTNVSVIATAMAAVGLVITYATIQTVLKHTTTASSLPDDSASETKEEV